MDSINIKGLEVFAHHGVYREENVLGQKSWWTYPCRCRPRRPAEVMI